MVTQKHLGRNFRMPQTKIDAFMDEYPWVRGFTADDQIAQVYVSRVEAGILDYHPHSADVSPTVWDDDFAYESIYLLDGSGTVVSVMSNRTIVTRKYLLFGPKICEVVPIKVNGIVPVESSVGSALNSLGEAAERVCFILSYFIYTKGVILYKSPKGVSVGGWIKRERQVQKEAVEQEAAAIDAQVS